MEPRQQRGLEIATQFRVRRTIGGWVVPSQSGSGKYAVIMSETPTCTCPDFETRGMKCKHVFAVEHVIERERTPDGITTVTETLRVTESVRRTYSQNWPAYNAAQTEEKDRFLILLRDLCRGISEPDPQRIGRPRIPLADAVFSVAFKVYSTVSGRPTTRWMRCSQPPIVTLRKGGETMRCCCSSTTPGHVPVKRRK